MDGAGGKDGALVCGAGLDDLPGTLSGTDDARDERSGGDRALGDDERLDLRVSVGNQEADKGQLQWYVTGRGRMGSDNSLQDAGWEDGLVHTRMDSERQ